MSIPMKIVSVVLFFVGLGPFAWFYMLPDLPQAILIEISFAILGCMFAEILFKFLLHE
jgi:hypothetical protein